MLPAGARVERDPLGRGLEVATQRDLLTRLCRVVSQTHVTREGLAQVDVAVEKLCFTHTLFKEQDYLRTYFK